MHLVAPHGYFQCVLEDSNGIYLAPHWVLAWGVNDDGDIAPITINGAQSEAVGFSRPTGEVEIFGMGVFANMGEARAAWADREEES